MGLRRWKQQEDGQPASIEEGGAGATGRHPALDRRDRTMKTDGKPRVLVVDDDQITADTLTEILKANGYAAEALYSGEATLEWIERNHPDVVLTDVRMRKVSGVETAARVRTLHPECRVILFTAAELSTEDKQTVEQLGLEFIERPMHPVELLARLRD